MSYKRMIRPLIAVCLTMWAGVAFGVQAARQLGLRPGFNFYSKEKDVELGKEMSGQVDKQVPLLNDPDVLRFINDLGHRLIEYEPLPADFSWQFKVVNTKDINAFALPGGFIYVNRGTIESAENEAQLAGVIAHETGHVVMRHGTHEATQRELAVDSFSILTGWFGQSSSIASQLTQMGIGLGLNSVLLHYSRAAESEADAVGTYVLYHARYDPHAMARFFQIIEKKYPTQTLQFFSDHPIPEDRIQAVDKEIPELGPAIQGKTDSPEFQAVKKRMLSMPPPPPEKETAE